MADDSRILITPEFRISYPQLVTPKKFQNKGEPTFTLEMIFDPEALSKFQLLDEAPADPKNPFFDVDVQQMILAVIKGKWGADTYSKDEWVRNWPVKSGDILANKRKGKGKEAILGKKLIKCKASAEYPPELLYLEDGVTKAINRGVDSQLVKAKALFVGGFYGFAEVTAKALDTPQGKFVTFYLNSIKLTREGERLGGESLMRRFDQSGVSGGVSGVDPTSGMGDDDSDIPF